MNDECSLSADEHIKYFEFLLDMYGKGWDNVVALIGDNCATNGAISKKNRFHLLAVLATDLTCVCKIL